MAREKRDSFEPLGLHTSLEHVLGGLVIDVPVLSIQVPPFIDAFDSSINIARLFD
jgi:hypothetical protein